MKILIVQRLVMVAMLAVAAACLIYLPGCSPSQEGSSIAGTWAYQEEKRIKSPDSRFEAVIMTGDAGATTSTTTFVLIVPTGTQVETNRAPSYAVFVADHLKSFQTFWKNTQLLVIQYDEARISNFRNLYEVLDGQSYYPIEIQLMPTQSGFSVPLNDRAPFSIK